MGKLLEQESAPNSTYRSLANLLGENGGISITNPQADHCAFIMKWDTDQVIPRISLSLHQLRPQERISLAHVDNHDSIPFSVPETTSPRRNVVAILKGIGVLLGDTHTKVKPIH